MWNHKIAATAMPYRQVREQNTWSLYSEGLRVVKQHLIQIGITVFWGYSVQLGFIPKCHTLSFIFREFESTKVARRIQKYPQHHNFQSEQTVWNKSHQSLQ